MSAILVLQAGPEINLSPITDRLWKAQIPHRVIVEGGTQNLLVTREEDAQQVKIWVDQWQKGELSKKPDARDDVPWQVSMQQQVLSAMQQPVTVILLLTCIACFIATYLGLLPLPVLMLDPELWNGEKLDMHSFWQNSFYRLWTPTLLHFSLLHILMNGFWWWILARAIERRDGSTALIGLTMVFGIASAFVQYQASGPFFGGLSGVNYGLMAWAWCRQKRYTHFLSATDSAVEGYDRYQLPQWLFPFMMVIMAIMMFLEPVGVGSNIGHESHLGGVLAGIILAFVWPINKTRRAMDDDAASVNEHDVENK